MRNAKFVRITATVTGFALVLILSRAAGAAQFFVVETLAEGGVSDDNARAATSFIRAAITSSGADTVTEDKARADFVIQPRLMRVGSVYVVTVEKKRGGEILFAAQSKVTTLEDLDRASRRATLAAINEPPPAIASRSTMPRENTDEGAPSAPYLGERAEPRRSARPPVVVVEQPELESSQPIYVRRDGRHDAESRTRLNQWPVKRKIGYTSLGLGSFFPRGLDSDNNMYNAMIGRHWDINPQVSLKALGEGSFSSGKDRARFYNVAAGASWFFGGAVDTAPYVTGDIGYGYARDAEERVAEGFSFGTGVGFRFFRLTETTLDLLLRYSVITDAIADEGNPSVVGIRLAVNF